MILKFDGMKRKAAPTVGRATDPLFANHKPDCQLRFAAECAVPIECDHGRDVCPICDPCTCGANLPKMPPGQHTWETVLLGVGVAGVQVGHKPCARCGAAWPYGDRWPDGLDLRDERCPKNPKDD